MVHVKAALVPLGKQTDRIFNGIFTEKAIRWDVLVEKTVKVNLLENRLVVGSAVGTIMNVLTSSVTDDSGLIKVLTN